jgi:hypothetical protein
MKLLKLFKRRKKNENLTQKPKSKVFEKVVMGAIIGGAIGSVVGVSILKNKKEEGKKTKFMLLRKLLGIKKKIPTETDKKDL